MASSVTLLGAQHLPLAIAIALGMTTGAGSMLSLQAMCRRPEADALGALQRELERERLESANRFQSFVEQLGGMPYIAALAPNAPNIYVSRKIDELLGYTQEEWCGEPGMKLRRMHEDDRAAFLQAVEMTISSGAPLAMDYRLYNANGAIRWFHDEARLATDAAGRPMYLHGVALDITERKFAQEELARSHHELKRLIGALDAVREDEQKRLAREMHDDMGQLLAAMKMDLSVLAQQLPAGDRSALRRVGDINELVNAMLISLRRIIADLPPKVLDDLGFFDALQLLARNFASRYGIPCVLHSASDQFPFSGKTASMLYRVIQESLNNVARHAQATQVDIRFFSTAASFEISISDNGKGASDADLAKAGSFGLICMRERVNALDGELRMDTSPGCGMTIRVSVPLPDDGSFIREFAPESTQPSIMTRL